MYTDVFFVEKDFCFEESYTGGHHPRNRIFFAGNVYAYGHIWNALQGLPQDTVRNLTLTGEMAKFSDSHNWGHVSDYSKGYLVEEDGVLSGGYKKHISHLNVAPSEPLTGVFYNRNFFIRNADTLPNTTWRAFPVGDVEYIPEEGTVRCEWAIESPWGIEKFFDGTHQEAYDLMVALATNDRRKLHPDLLKKVSDARRISTPHFQTWKVVALMSGLGFQHIRLYGNMEGGYSEDVFFSEEEVECVHDGWIPSKDGSRLTSWEDLSNAESPHYGRHYITAFQFTAPTGHQNIIVWVSDSHKDVLYHPIALSSVGDWERFFEDFTYEGWQHFLQYNGVKI